MVQNFRIRKATTVDDKVLFIENAEFRRLFPLTEHQALMEREVYIVIADNQTIKTG